MKQNWQAGQRVKVGFMADLLVLEKVVSPKNYRPDGYVLAKGDKLYAFVPHNGGLCRVASINEAIEIIKS